MSAGQSAPAIDANALEVATDITVFNSKGENVRFGDIFSNQKTIVVFIRAYNATRATKARMYSRLTLLFLPEGHFYCGVRYYVLPLFSSLIVHHRAV
jgi:hypothetical protein